MSEMSGIYCKSIGSTFWNPVCLRALGWMLEAQAPSHLFTAMLSSHVRTSRFERSYSSARREQNDPQV